MKNSYYMLVWSILIIACTNGPKNDSPSEEMVIDTYEERLEEIEKYTALLYKDSFNFNKTHAESLLGAYEDFLKHHKANEEAKDYFFKTGELAKALNKPNQAIQYFDILINEYPEHEKTPIALFYKAIIVDDELNKDALAKSLYQEFIDKYPDHALTESARESILLVGKSLEEIVAGFEEKNG